MVNTVHKIHKHTHTHTHTDEQFIHISLTAFEKQVTNIYFSINLVSIHLLRNS